MWLAFWERRAPLQSGDYEANCYETADLAGAQTIKKQQMKKCHVAFTVCYDTVAALLTSKKPLILAKGTLNFLGFLAGWMVNVSKIHVYHELKDIFYFKVQFVY